MFKAQVRTSRIRTYWPNPRLFELTAPDRIVCVPNSDAENKILEAPFQITVRFALLRNCHVRNTNYKPLK
ncbi:hypothetical protein J2Z50_001595 [Ensifer mexicanus]|nr:hypothetical protein [Sinorhizobium mexicanum]